MNHYYFSCLFEEQEWRLRAAELNNQWLQLYEVEPEDKLLLNRFGTKFITKAKDSALDVRCLNSLEEHREYETALLIALKQHLITQRFS